MPEMCRAVLTSNNSPKPIIVCLSSNNFFPFSVRNIRLNNILNRGVLSVVITHYTVLPIMFWTKKPSDIVLHTIRAYAMFKLSRQFALIAERREAKRSSAGVVCNTIARECLECNLPCIESNPVGVESRTVGFQFERNLFV